MKKTLVPPKVELIHLSVIDTVSTSYGPASREVITNADRAEIWNSGSSFEEGGSTWFD